MSGTIESHISDGQLRSVVDDSVLEADPVTTKEQIKMRSIPDKSNCEQIFKCDGNWVLRTRTRTRPSVTARTLKLIEN